MGRSRKDPYSPTEEISAVRRRRGEKIVSDNSKSIRTSEKGRGVNLLFPPWGWYGCFLESKIQNVVPEHSQVAPEHSQVAPIMPTP